jgi:hypothetical protein
VGRNKKGEQVGSEGSQFEGITTKAIKEFKEQYVSWVKISAEVAV